MLYLAQAITRADVEKACVDKDIACYDFNRHSNLRRNFVSILVRVDGARVDCHKHFIE